MATFSIILITKSRLSWNPFKEGYLAIHSRFFLHISMYVAETNKRRGGKGRAINHVSTAIQMVSKNILFCTESKPFEDHRHH